ncbi:syntaxin-binding protein 5 isoform X7 [Drosophila yakuba]|uniref:syntaxin-binding protein 5 isoform X7 n=1 Tax=Drosophila yakuba TaxID=7245 RepID=UPI0019308541|nr:syntaxin-binding protein 5 isoform X7 [Drosophila yakuba]
MKKFTFKGVLDGFRQSVQPQATRQEQEIQEQLKADHFTLKKTFRHGFPYSPTSFAFDPVQKLLAIGDKSGYIRILGRPGVDAHAKHEGESECAVLFAQFLVNEGALVTVTADDTIHLWSIRQKTPRIVQSLKFQRERVTCIHLPVGSKWLYVGTEKGNIHVVHIDTFALSGYIINWNKAIEVVRTSHPGAVIALCDNPLDANKLLIAFECGLLVLWDLKAKCAELRWQAAEAVKSLAWHYEGKYFVSSHTDGSICSWPTKPQAKPQSQVCPHAKINKDGNAEKCKPIYKVDLKSSATGETFTIFSGGMPSEKGSKSNCITVMVGKATTVLEMEHAVCDFITLCENPWPCETQEPYAIAVLLQYDLVLIDLLTPGFPCFESPYPMDLHESPVTCCTYLTDCPSDLVPAFYSVGRTTTSKKSCFSEREWPISGGEWSPASCSYSEIVITGHQDGSLKFWDSGAGTLQILYKLKTAKMFEKPRSHVAHSHPESDNPLAVHLIFLCSESRRLCVAGAMGQVMLFKFRKVESTSEVLVLEIPILYENFDDIYGTSPECDFLTGHQVQKAESSDSDKTAECSLKVRFGAQRKPPGFQSQLVCLTTGPNRRNVQVTSLCISSSYGLSTAAELQLQQRSSNSNSSSSSSCSSYSNNNSSSYSNSSSSSNNNNSSSSSNNRWVILVIMQHRRQREQQHWRDPPFTVQTMQVRVLLVAVLVLVVLAVRLAVDLVVRLSRNSSNRCRSNSCISYSSYSSNRSSSSSSSNLLRRLVIHGAASAAVVVLVVLAAAAAAVQAVVVVLAVQINWMELSQDPDHRQCPALICLPLNLLPV